jgi:hypothetical protein
MRISKRVPITVLVAISAALTSALVVGAFSALGSAQSGQGKGPGGQLPAESLAPSLPGDPTFHGVNPAVRHGC